MTGSAASTRDVWTQHVGYLMAWTLNISMGAGFGLTAVLADPHRFAAPTYAPLRASLGVPGWGAVLLLFVTLLILAPWLPARGTIAAFILGGLSYLTLAIYFALGIPDPMASPWGPIAFGGLGLWQLTQAVAYLRALPADPPVPRP